VKEEEEEEGTRPESLEVAIFVPSNVVNAIIAEQPIWYPNKIRKSQSFFPPKKEKGGARW
jgi:hypothetical protein